MYLHPSASFHPFTARPPNERYSRCDCRGEAGSARSICDIISDNNWLFQGTSMLAHHHNNEEPASRVCLPYSLGAACTSLPIRKVTRAQVWSPFLIMKLKNKTQLSWNLLGLGDEGDKQTFVASRDSLSDQCSSRSESLPSIALACL